MTVGKLNSTTDSTKVKISQNLRPRVQAALRALSVLKSLLPHHNLFSKLEPLIKNLKIVVSRIDALTREKISEYLGQIETAESSLNEFIKNHENDPDKRALNEAKKCLRELLSLKEEFLSALDEKGKPGIRIETEQVKATEDSRRLTDAILRQSLLTPPNTPQEEPSRTSGELTLGEGQKIRFTPRERKTETASKIQELFGRIMAAFASEKLIRKIAGVTERGGKLTPKKLENIIRELNAEIARIMAEIQTKTNLRASNSKKIRCKISPSKEASTVQFEIDAKLSVEEAVKTVISLIHQSEPAEILPQVVEAAAQMAIENPQNQFDICRFVATVMTPAPEPEDNSNSTASGNAAVLTFPAKNPLADQAAAPHFPTGEEKAPEVFAAAPVPASKLIPLPVPVIHVPVIHESRIPIPKEPKEAARPLPGRRSAAGSKVEEAISLLIETAIRLICKTPEQKIAISHFITETISQIFRNSATATSSTAASGLIPKSTPLSENTLPSPNLSATASNLPRSTVAAIVRDLIDETEKTLAHTPNGSTEVQTQKEARMEITRNILLHNPGTALSVLIEASSSQNPKIREVLKPLIIELAQTEGGQRYVLNLFSQESAKSILSMPSEAIYNVVLKTAQSILINARAPERFRVAAKPDGREQLFTISRLIANANPSKLSVNALTVKTAGEFLETVKTAGEFLELVARTQRCFEAAGIKSLRRPKRLRAGNARTFSRKFPGSNVHRLTSSPTKNRPVQADKIIVTREAARALLKTTETTNLLVPKAVIDSLEAGLAGVNLIPAKVTAAGVPYALPPESGSASSLKRIVEILGIQLTRTIEAKSPSWAKAPSLSELEHLYAITLRLVRLVVVGGGIAEVDKVIDELREKRKLKELIKILKGKEASKVETVTREILELEALRGSRVVAAA